MAKMKLMWDPNMRVAPRTIQNYLWAFAVNIPPGAPPGVAIAEFRNAREALNAERLCKRFKPRPLDVEWITPRPQTNYGPPGSYYDVSHFYNFCFKIDNAFLIFSNKSDKLQRLRR